MAAKKPTPARTPKRKTAPKVFDVARPGQSVATSTSKPVLITNRPVMHDPMVNEVTRDDLSAPPLPSPSAKKVVIKPIHDDVVPDKPTTAVEPVDEIAEAVAVAVAVKPTAKSEPSPEPDTEPEPIEPETSEPESIEFSKTVSGVPTQNPTVADNTLRAPTTDAVAGQPTIASVTPEPSVPAGTPNVQNDKQLSPEQADTALLAAQKRVAELERIIDREQYFLPIKTVEERRSRRIALIGLLVIIVLGLAWYDTALDAGLVNNAYNLPHTHLFTLK